MRRVPALAFCAFALPAAADVPREVLDTVQRLPPTTALEAPLRAAACAFAPAARHLGPLPSNLAWARPNAAALLAGLPGLPEAARAAVIRPTRELLARAATRERIAEGGITLHGIDLSPLPANAAAPAFLAIIVPPPAAPPEGCVVQGPR